MKVGDIVNKSDKKGVRFLLSWNKSLINFGIIEFKTDGSLIYSSAFHNDPDISSEIEFGISVLKGKILTKRSITSKVPNTRGIHISLHPRKQVMHVREHYPGQIIHKREFTWFLVNKPFNLLHVFSPPLDQCKNTLKTSGFVMPIPNTYKDSIELKIDIFPRDTKTHVPYRLSTWDNWGYCPNYLVRTSFILAKQRVPALVFWPDDSNLSL